MFYILQENVFRESHYETIRNTLERFKLPFTVVRIFPFTDKIVALEDIPDGPYELDDLPEFIAPAGPVFVFGAVKLARVAAAKNWQPGSMLNENHDFMVYREHYRENLLNWDSEILQVKDDILWAPGAVYFIRPTIDSKSFTGAVFTEMQWRDKKASCISQENSLTWDSLIQVCKPKNIQKEIRFWVVDGRIVTGSQYRSGNKTVYDSFFEQEAAWFAQGMVNLYRLADAFVIDVCLSDGIWKIVECGCINCAGFYHSDVQRTIMALEEKFGS